MENSLRERLFDFLFDPAGLPLGLATAEGADKVTTGVSSAKACSLLIKTALASGLSVSSFLDIASRARVLGEDGGGGNASGATSVFCDVSNSVMSTDSHH